MKVWWLIQLDEDDERFRHELAARIRRLAAKEGERS